MTPQQPPTKVFVTAMTGSAFLPTSGIRWDISPNRGPEVSYETTSGTNDLPTTAKRGLSANERAERIFVNKARAAAITKGRQRLAKVIEKRNPGYRSLSALRLAAGLSQTELAHKMSMQQPNIARLEKTPGDPSLSTLQKLAKALDVDIAQVIAAVEATKKGYAKDV